MSFTEIVEELRKLSPEELEAVQRTLDEVRQGRGQEIEETPEMRAAIDEGIRSAKEEPLIPIEEVIAEIKTWNTKSS
jgi:predicted transcriptional regulator